MKMERGGAGKEINRCEEDYMKSEEEEEEEEEEKELIEMEVRRGPWTVEEDFTLINYIAHHGEGRWNSLSRSAGLKRTGKSCRLRWLNYLRPDVRRGNITLEEQLLILELHSRWGNRWSKIAQHLPGRTDNEIKNYWRTRVQKHAKQLKCDVNSKQFKDTMRYLWMPRLVERIQVQANTTQTHHFDITQQQQQQQPPPLPNDHICADALPDNSSAAASSDSFGSTPPDCYNNYTINQNQYQYQYQDPPANQIIHQPLTTDYFNQGGFDFIDQNTTQWMDAHAHAHADDGADASNNLWNVDDIWFLHNHV